MAKKAAKKKVAKPKDVCPNCDGSGTSATDDCGNCKGKGKV